jgi:flagellar basal body-associated protein FliL
MYAIIKVEKRYKYMDNTTNRNSHKVLIIILVVVILVLVAGLVGLKVGKSSKSTTNTTTAASTATNTAGDANSLVSYGLPHGWTQATI